MRSTLWPACVRAHPFEAQLRAARDAGYTHLPIGLATYRALRDSGLGDSGILALYRDHGISPGHYDGFSAWAPEPFDPRLPEEARAVFDASAEECLDICSALGLERICATGAFLPGRFSPAALKEGFHAFCGEAAGFGVRVELEFLPMWGVADLATAMAVLGEHPPENAGLLLDSWHFFRSSSTLDQLAALPSGLVRTLQLADAGIAPRSTDLLEDCLLYRRPPGDGEFALRDWLRALAHQPVDDIGPEIFSVALDEMPAGSAASACREATARVLPAGWSDGFRNAAARSATLPGHSGPG